MTLKLVSWPRLPRLIMQSWIKRRWISFFNTERRRISHHPLLLRTLLFTDLSAVLLDEAMEEHYSVGQTRRTCSSDGAWALCQGSKRVSRCLHTFFLRARRCVAAQQSRSFFFHTHNRKSALLQRGVSLGICRLLVLNSRCMGPHHRFFAYRNIPSCV